MPTFKHTPTGKKVFFAHIPRTAGRFIEQNLLENNDFVWDDPPHLETGLGVMSVVHGAEVAHWHRDLYQKYLSVENIPHFSVVRDPITRFISGSIYIKRVYGKDIQSVMEDPIMFSSMITNLPFDESYNWYRPQIDFLTDKTHVWKFEDGFKEDFASWLSGIVGVDLVMNDVEYPISKDEKDKDSRLKPSPSLIHILKQVYKKDLDRFYQDS